MFNRKLLFEQIVEEIIRRINAGIYKPGARLPTEQELSAEFNVSRNSIREAIKCLELGKVLSGKPGKGIILSENALEIIRHKEINFEFRENTFLKDLVQVRLMIEPQAAEMAAEYAVDEQKKELEELLQRSSKEIIDNYKKYGYSFHRKIIEMTGNICLIEMMDAISKQLFLCRSYLDVLREHSMEEMLAEHDDIYNTIKRGDSKKAKLLMEMHIKKSYLV